VKTAARQRADEHISEARVASMGGLLRDALKLGAKPEALVKEAIARNDDIALHHLLGDSLWPLYAAKGVDLRALRSAAAEQRWAAGQTFPGSALLAFLCGDGAELGAQARCSGGEVQCGEARPDEGAPRAVVPADPRPV
jgi:hypothetical protein